VWVDTGGTFTDCVARDPEGRTRRTKVLSSGAVRGRVLAKSGPRAWQLELPWRLPDRFAVGWGLVELGAEESSAEIVDFVGERTEVSLDRDLEIAPGAHVELRSPEEAAVLAVRVVTGTPAGVELPPLELRLATTRGTNALLERRGAEVALFVTRGFGDLLTIGNQQRPDLFALEVRQPEPLYAHVVEVDERLSAGGEVLRSLAADHAAAEAARLVGEGIRVAAVSLLHGYRSPVHERQLAALLRREGFTHVSTSSELTPLIRYVPRTETTVVDAYLAPVIEGYVGGVRSSLELADLKLMTSAGGLMGAEHFRPKESLLSGPAGGVVGAAAAGVRSGFRRVIAFDMGGTSTDVSRFDGEYDYRFDTRVGDAHLMSPALAIETVAAGGGSICSLEVGVPKVGPESAGACPGPACYGAGGPLSLTDVNLLLGRLAPDRFEIPIDRGAADERVAELLADARRSGDARPDAESLLAGFLQIANERMAEAVRRISVREGYDPTDYALVAFGGAGAQHACALARMLGMARVVVPADAGLLSAVGLGAAVVERFRERQVLAPLDEVEPSLAAWLDELAERACAAVAAEGIPADEVVVRLRRVHLRLSGQDATLAIDFDSGSSLRESFDRAYMAHYGYRPEERAVEVESLRVAASSAPGDGSAVGAGELDRVQDDPTDPPRPVAETRAYFGGRWSSASIFDRFELARGTRLPGPALIFERHSAIVVEAGWTATVDDVGAVVMRWEGGDG
jgi:5-oxoprolinase (ATP-hydrolysing)